MMAQSQSPSVNNEFRRGLIESLSYGTDVFVTSGLERNTIIYFRKKQLISSKLKNNPINPW